MTSQFIYYMPAGDTACSQTHFVEYRFLRLLQIRSKHSLFSLYDQNTNYEQITNFITNFSA
jgi:hypothetical protein